MKNNYILIFIIFISLNIYSQDNNNLPLNEIPMYGGNKITEHQKKANEKFIKEIEKLNVSKNDAAKHSIQRGWEAYRKGDFSTSIKRFNQAWLLDPKNPDIYWGFGNYLGAIQNFEESIKMFYKCLELDTNNISIMADLAKSYNMNGFKKSYEGNKDELEINLKKAIEIIEKAVLIEKEFGILYHHWAVSLFYLGRSKESLEKIEIAIKLGEKVPKKFIKMIKKDIKKQKK